MSDQPPPQPSEHERTVMLPSGSRPGAAPSASHAQNGNFSASPPFLPPGPGQASGADHGPDPVADVLRRHGLGLNPLVRAANPLLSLVVPLRYLGNYTNLEDLRRQLVQAVGSFESEARASQVDHETLAAARYALCTFLDETISSTPWGGSNVWSTRSLLVAFHNEAFGGEKFFLIMQRLAQDPAKNLDVLELMYLCLALGMEGRYRVIENGRSQLEALRERLQQMIQTQRGPFEPALSPHWAGASGKRASLLGTVPVWVMAAAVSVLLLGLWMFLSHRLNSAAKPVLDGLGDIRPPVAARSVARPQEPAKSVVRLAGFLEEDVRAGRVSVWETAESSTVTLHGNGAFASGSAEVKPDFISVMVRIGDELEKVDGNVKVVGHTDSVPPAFSSRYRNNWDLSKARAEAVVRLLASRSRRVPPDGRFTVEPKGDTEPLPGNDHDHNRRVDIILMTPPARQ